MADEELLRATDERFMREALEQAQRAQEEGEVPIGAVVVHEGRVIARAHNRRETDEDPSAHAEFSALVEASRMLGRWRLSGCTVYVTLEPCAMCAGLMVNARIDRCVFGASDPKGGATGTLYDLAHDSRLNHTFSVTPGVLAEECSSLLRGFFASLRERGAGSNVAAGLSSRASACGCGADAPIGSNAECATGPMGQSAPAIPTSPTPPTSSATPIVPANPSAPMNPLRPRSLASSAPRVLLAIDSFKGSATSAQVESWVEEGVRSAAPAASVTKLPIADGGEGTAESLAASLGGKMRTICVSGPTGHSVEASYLLVDRADAAPEAGGAACGERAARRVADSPSGRVAVIDMASAAGITLSACSWDDALAATTYGVGELLLDAVSQGAQTIYVGLGGSATSDVGAGMLQALGAHLLDEAGSDVHPGLGGLGKVDSIDIAPARRALAGARVIALNDVAITLLGRRGTLRVYGAQKGLEPSTEEREAAIAAFDADLARFAHRLTLARDALDGSDLQVSRPGARPRSLAGVPGTGAAGGLGVALLAIGAQLAPGIETILDLSGFDDALAQADLVITGEGNMDGQSSDGKAPVGIAARARRAGVPVIAVVGGRSDDLSPVYSAGVDVVLPIVRRPMDLARAMSAEEAHLNLACAGETAVRAYLMGR